jgi:hypothetical protein
MTETTMKTSIAKKITLTKHTTNNMPREKMPVWEYDPSNRYALVAKYTCITDVQHKLYGAKVPIFRYHNQIHIMPNGNILLKSPLGKLTLKWVLKEMQIMNDPFSLKKYNRSEMCGVDILNESGDVIAWFANVSFIDTLKDNIHTSSAVSELNKERVRLNNKSGIYYRKSTKTYNQ